MSNLRPAFLVLVLPLAAAAEGSVADTLRMSAGASIGAGYTSLEIAADTTPWRSSPPSSRLGSQATGAILAGQLGVHFPGRVNLLLEAQLTAGTADVEGHHGYLSMASLAPIAMLDFDRLVAGVGAVYGGWAFTEVFASRVGSYYGAVFRFEGLPVRYRPRPGARSHGFAIWFEVRPQWSRALLADGHTVSPVFALSTVLGLGYDTL